MDLIDRQAAINAVKRNTFRLTFAEEQNCEGHVAWSAEAVYSDVIEGELLELPSVEAKPVIRCKDCVRWMKSDFGNVCTLYATDRLTQPYDFCSYGHRKGGEI